MTHDYSITVSRPGKRLENPNKPGEYGWRYAVKTAYGMLVVFLPGPDEHSDEEIGKVAKRAIDERPV